MPFQTILSELVNDIDGAIGAMFLDWEGESVGLVGSPDKYDMKLIGAYQGIFLTQLKRLTRDTDLGEVSMFKLSFEGASFFNAVLEDGYYLSLAAGHEAIEGLIWVRLERARQMLNSEIV